MALVRCDFFSDVLAFSTSMTVILPQTTTGQIGMTGRVGAGDFPVLYLLQGLSDDNNIWLRRTSTGTRRSRTSSRGYPCVATSTRSA